MDVKTRFVLLADNASNIYICFNDLKSRLTFREFFRQPKREKQYTEIIQTFDAIKGKINIDSLDFSNIFIEEDFIKTLIEKMSLFPINTLIPSVFNNSKKNNHLISNGPKKLEYPFL